MRVITDIRHFLDERGELPVGNLPVRRHAIRLAQLVEAGGPLEVGQLRETLVACAARRPDGASNQRHARSLARSELNDA